REVFSVGGVGSAGAVEGGAGGVRGGRRGLEGGRRHRLAARRHERNGGRRGGHGGGGAGAIDGGGGRRGRGAFAGPHLAVHVFRAADGDICEGPHDHARREPDEAAPLRRAAAVQGP